MNHTFRLIEKIFYLVGKLAKRKNIKINKPIFIVGSGRCGSDLLLKILSSHPMINSYPNEANHLWHPKLYDKENYQKDLMPIEIDPRVYTEKSLLLWPPKHGNFIYETFLGYHVLMEPKEIFIVKSAMISFMLPKIIEIFPNASFVHIYRNGPSVVASYINKNFQKYQHLPFSIQEYREYVSRYWNMCILELDKVKTAIKKINESRFYELSYENLCNNPSLELHNLGVFLGIDPCKFTFDISKIESRNYKIGNYKFNDQWKKPLEIMKEGMELKEFPE